MSTEYFLTMTGIYVFVFSPFWVTLLLWWRWRRTMASHIKFAALSSLILFCLLLVSIYSMQMLADYGTAYFPLHSSHVCKRSMSCSAIELLYANKPIIWMVCYLVLGGLFGLLLKLWHPRWIGFAPKRRSR